MVHEMLELIDKELVSPEDLEDSAFRGYLKVYLRFKKE